MLDQEQLSVGQGKFTKDPMVFFEFGNTCIFTLNDSTYYGKYMTRGDSIDIIMKNSFSNITSIKGVLARDGKLLSGLIDDGQTIEILLEKKPIK